MEEVPEFQIPENARGSVLQYEIWVCRECGESSPQINSADKNDRNHLWTAVHQDATGGHRKFWRYSLERARGQNW